MCSPDSDKAIVLFDWYLRESLPSALETLVLIGGTKLVISSLINPPHVSLASQIKTFLFFLARKLAQTRTL